MKHINETTVERILSIDETPYQSKLEEYREEWELFRTVALKNRTQLKIDKMEYFLLYLKQLKQLIKKQKLKPKTKVAITFIPEVKAVKKDSMYLSKFGGVPSCFFENIKNTLDDKNKAFEVLRKVYPKDAGNYFYLKFVGEIESSHPTFFMNEVIEEITYKPYRSMKDSHSIGTYFNKERYNDEVHLAPSMAASIFIDQNFGSANLTPNGVMKSLRFDWREEIEPETQKKYLSIMKEFLEKEVDKEEYFSIDKQDLKKIVAWYPTLEVMDEDSDSASYVECFGPIEYKLFGYPRSQQSLPLWYGVNGYFGGPRLLAPFLTMNSRKVDSFVQVYADILDFNTAQEIDRVHIKVDISGT